MTELNEHVITSIEDQKETKDNVIFTGFNKFDDLIGGLHRSELALIAARQGMGKTSMGINIIMNAALSGKYRVGIFSLDLPTKWLVHRMLCSTAQIDVTKTNSGDLSYSDWEKIELVKTQIDKSDIFIDDAADTSLTDIIEKCRKVKQEKGLDIVLVDYLELISTERCEKREDEIVSIVKELKNLAKELNMAILLCTSLRRFTESNKNAIPTISDLHYGTITKYIDTILFLHANYDKWSRELTEEETREKKLIVTNHPWYKTATIDLIWHENYMRFEEK